MTPLVLDVRPILASGGTPCESVDAAIAQLQPGQEFHLLIPFEPQPLYAKLGRLGYDHHSNRLEDKTWKIEFTPGKAPRPPSSEGCGCGCHHHEPEANIELDARKLAPPEPMVRTLEALGQLEKGRKLILFTTRKPLHLLEQLEERGFAYDSSELPDRSFITRIWHATHDATR